jgi:coenzyme Q-binding protein COQ10
LAKVKFEKFTNATREKIFEIATNYESFQTILPEFFPSIRVISVRPNTTLVEEHLKLGGKELIVMAKHVTDESKTHEIFIVGGDAKGTHIIEEYEQTPEGTRIVLTVDFKLKGPMRMTGIFGKGKVENEFSNIMDKLILIAEN